MTEPWPPPPPPPPPPPTSAGLPEPPPPVPPAGPGYPEAPPAWATTPSPYPLVPPPYGPPPVLPAGAPPLPVVRWGMGDVMYGLVLWLAGGVLGTIYLFATGGVDVQNAELGELQVGTLAIVLSLGWVGFVGWPLVATYRKGQRSLRKDFGVDIRWIDVGWGLLGGVGAIAVSAAGALLWTVISGDPSPRNAEFLPSSPGLFEALAIWFLVAVCTPFAEELFFRGLMLRAVGRRWGLVVGTVASSIVFGMFHITTFDLSGLFIVGVTACYGAVFALLVIRAEGRLGPALVAHSLVNTLGVLVLVFT